MTETARVKVFIKQHVPTQWFCHAPLLRISNTETATSGYKGHLQTTQNVCQKDPYYPHIKDKKQNKGTPLGPKREAASGCHVCCTRVVIFSVFSQWKYHIN